MKETYATERLSLRKLTVSDAPFVFELVNTQEWKQFIGEKNIGHLQDAENYIQKIVDNPNADYWVVKTKEGDIPIGIITIIKRDYLPHHDLGFAFLPRFGKRGYAYEAANKILSEIKGNNQHEKILATTLEQNKNSILLLEKLGFGFQEKILNEKQELLLYSISI